MSSPPRRSWSTRCAGAAPVGLAALVGLVGACGGSGSDGLSSTAADGRRLAISAGCTRCHGTDGQGGVGPPWVGLFGSEVPLEDGTTVTADEAYLTRSITDPAAQRHAGFAVAMPENDLGSDDVARIVAYIVELEE